MQDSYSQPFLTASKSSETIILRNLKSVTGVFDTPQSVCGTPSWSNALSGNATGNLKYSAVYESIYCTGRYNCSMLIDLFWFSASLTIPRTGSQNVILNSCRRTKISKSISNNLESFGYTSS